MNSQYEEAVKMQVLIPANRVDEIKKAVTEATNARASVTDEKNCILPSFRRRIPSV